MWIMLIKKLPTSPSPPKLSIFWSTPWPGPDANNKYTGDKCANCGVLIQSVVKTWGTKSKETLFCGCENTEPVPVTEDDKIFPDLLGFGLDRNWIKARRIHYKGEDIRVFPDEYSIMQPENMYLYITGDEQSGPSHELVADSVASDREINAILDGETRPVYESALNEGATHAQAMLVALGMDITVESEDFPPAIGWYRPLKWAAEPFCYEWEMKDD